MRVHFQITLWIGPQRISCEKKRIKWCCWMSVRTIHLRCSWKLRLWIYQWNTQRLTRPLRLRRTTWSKRLLRSLFISTVRKGSFGQGHPGSRSCSKRRSKRGNRLQGGRCEGWCLGHWFSGNGCLEENIYRIHFRLLYPSLPLHRNSPSQVV